MFEMSDPAGVAPPAPAVTPATSIIAAAAALLPLLARGAVVDSRTLRAIMAGAFAGTDAEGAWC
jgi:hypothetical protein